MIEGTTEDHEDGAVTLPSLIIQWSNRDLTYATRSTTLTPEEIRAIRAGRLREVATLPVAERAAAYIRVRTWWPPEHGQGRL